MIESVPAAKKVVVVVTVAVAATKIAVKRRRTQKCLSRKRSLWRFNLLCQVACTTNYVVSLSYLSQHYNNIINNKNCLLLLFIT